MVGCCKIPGARFSTASERSCNSEIIACVVARLPAVMMVMLRSPGTVQLNIFRLEEILSTPAFVRVSDMKTSPLSSFMPTQYVMRRVLF